MKKTIILLFIAIVAFGLVGCDGTMHNTPLSYVNFKFTNFDSLSGTSLYVVGGTKDEGWGSGFIDSHKVTFAAGAATLATNFAILSGSFEFTLTTDGWARPWLNVDTAGNSGGLPANSNFLVTVPMDGGTHTITVDASTNPVTLTVN